MNEYIEEYSRWRISLEECRTTLEKQNLDLVHLKDYLDRLVIKRDSLQLQEKVYKEPLTQVKANDALLLEELEKISRGELKKSNVSAAADIFLRTYNKKSIIFGPNRHLKVAKNKLTILQQTLKEIQAATNQEQVKHIDAQCIEITNELKGLYKEIADTNEIIDKTLELINLEKQKIDYVDERIDVIYENSETYNMQIRGKSLKKDMLAILSSDKFTDSQKEFAFHLEYLSNPSAINKVLNSPEFQKHKEASVNNPGIKIEEHIKSLGKSDVKQMTIK